MDAAKKNALAEFITKVNRLKTAQNKLSDSEFDHHILKTHFGDMIQTKPTPHRTSQFYIITLHRKSFVALATMVVVLCAFFVYSPLRQALASYFMKIIQSFIYPGMSVWRMLTVPVISLFPALTQLYDESCLLGNPLFQIQDMDCRPCQHVLNVDVIDVDREPLTEVVGGGVPYVFKTDDDAPAISVDLLHQHVLRHALVYRQDAYKVTSTNPKIQNLDDMFADFQNTTILKQTPSHTIWRCNRMNPLRLLRPLIRHPSRLPRTGMSIERFLAIDTPDAPSYSIPDTECSNVFIYQVLGSRTLILRPTSECGAECRTISVRLAESHVLMYDWWYWKPVSMADHEQRTPSISYIGAYC